MNPSSHQSCSIKAPSLKKVPYKNAILLKPRFTNKITPHQKAILIHQFNSGNKKIKNVRINNLQILKILPFIDCQRPQN